MQGLNNKTQVNTEKGQEVTQGGGGTTNLHMRANL